VAYQTASARELLADNELNGRYGSVNRAAFKSDCCQ
jgi:hypothetical protein